MNTVSVAFQNCPWTTDGLREIAFSGLDLRHAAVAVGRNWRFRGISTADRAHNQARIHEIISIVELQGGGAARVSAHYRAIGSTMRGAKSFMMGNAFCALIAEKELRIPWLVDVEALSHHYQVQFNGTRRADFIGRSTSRDWFAFEAKGRSYYPPQAALDDWKIQADSVRRINGRQPEANVVSATCASDDEYIRMIWRDPPADDGEDLEFSEEDFFQSYYAPILDLIDHNERILHVGQETLAVFPDLRMSIGVHSRIRDSLVRNDFEAVVRFAADESPAQQFPGLADEDTKVFRDGLIISLKV
jgi:hypothetical protein